MSCRIALGGITRPPTFAAIADFVAMAFEELLIGLQGVWKGSPQLGCWPQLPEMATCQNGGTGRRAGGGADKSIFKIDAFTGDPVKIGGLDSRVSGKGCMNPGLVVGNDKKKVGAFCPE